MIEKNWTPKKEPWLPHDYDDNIVMAIRALVSGTANSGQQIQVWEYINYICGSSDKYMDLSFRPGVEGQIATTFAEGKKFVGLQLRKLLHHALTPDVAPPDEGLTRRQIAQRMRREREKAGANGKNS
jgi:hypothetical protein